MPASIFSETEWARLARFPEEIPGDDLIRAFTLTGADRDLVAIRRGAANRLGLALQLCALRYLGFVPRNLSAAPRSAACFVADQLAYRITHQGPIQRFLAASTHTHDETRLSFLIRLESLLSSHRPGAAVQLIDRASLHLKGGLKGSKEHKTRIAPRPAKPSADL